ncbi:Piso0_001467 [Millerozyma farinosa CBS 7064]|uniref:Altered inheritance of mitochondria protein 11 n=1 Tax=Pichia sorbitophila (strain ATCC MYA-4447 / BCRC 22081 / CBS 7064 / NBRC 10061 / NRRL Y-12695) TaxID=559304 RepID=G8YKV6_PICSO|nr:Piso0_001467 [Millerozyma farinosa CBS 7064]
MSVNEFLRDKNFKLASSSDEYKQRRKRQMGIFMATVAMTLLSSRIAYRSTVKRQYIPTLFQGNHSPPLSYNATADAAAAVGTGTMLCGSVCSMLVSGTCWVLDVSSFREFGWRMKTLLGGADKERDLAGMPMDSESSLVQDSLNSIISGDYDFDKVK